MQVNRRLQRMPRAEDFQICRIAKSHELCMHVSEMECFSWQEKEREHTELQQAGSIHLNVARPVA